MAKDNKYGKIEIPGIPENENVFILREQDVFAIPTLRFYEYITSHLPGFHGASVRQAIERFRGGSYKIPDTKGDQYRL